jgi:hypothetical protein
MLSLRAQGHKIHAIPRPVSHPRIPGNGTNMMKKKATNPVPWPTPDNIISPGTATKNGEQGTLIAMTDMIVASRRDFSEDGSSINASRAKPYSHRKGQNIRPRRSGKTRIEMRSGARCTGPTIELTSTNKLSA